MGLYFPKCELSISSLHILQLHHFCMPHLWSLPYLSPLCTLQSHLLLSSFSSSTLPFLCSTSYSTSEVHCIRSSTFSLLQSVHFLSSLLNPLHFPLPPGALLYPFSLDSILHVFFLLTPTHLYITSLSGHKYPIAYFSPYIMPLIQQAIWQLYLYGYPNPDTLGYSIAIRYPQCKLSYII